MGTENDDASVMYAPVGGGTAPRASQRINGTGTTESGTSTALRQGALATIKNGANSIRVSFRAASGGSTQVATTDLILGPYERFDWKVTDETDFVYGEAGDGAATYEAWVWQSSPGTL